MYYCFIHSSTDRHLGCFYVLAIVNSAVMNVGVHVSLSILVSLVCMLGAGALGRPRGMVQGGRREGGSEWGTHVYLWRIHVQFSSVAQSYLTLCDPMNLSTPGLPVHHQLPEFTQTDVHRVGDAIQPSHPLSSPSPPALNLSQHQGLFK